VAAQLQAYQGSILVREVADDLAQGIRQLAHERRDGNDLVILRKPRIHHQVDHFDVVPAGQMLLANALQISDRRHGFRRLAGGVEA